MPWVADYIIRTSDTQDWPAVHVDRQAQVLLPEGHGCEQADGWGDFRMMCGGTTVTFSGEMNGWQVVVEGPMARDAADALIEVVTRQIEAEVGVACEWVTYD